jgi:hypothetical protein
MSTSTQHFLNPLSTSLSHIDYGAPRPVKAVRCRIRYAAPHSEKPTTDIERHSDFRQVTQGYEHVTSILHRTLILTLVAQA